ncbi:MAG TPA: phosphoglycerate mutase, partial [Candidatus Hydrogenedentes bacterium]|nr:phosphoglycerate mutase [Candidatus Hydrogenedentota bacterium]
HVEAPDETAHQGRVDLKIQAITDFDARVVAPCLDYASRQGDTRLLVAPHHFTLISTKTHAGGPVPFGIAGPGIPNSEAAGYSEGIAASSGILIPEGYTLVRRFFREATIRF